MTPGQVRNDFLSQLLNLQQDGKHAISAPTNWMHQPQLEVPTDVDAIIDSLQESMLSGKGANDTARWHFFIGSPGNGKSAAMGKLYRRLISSKGCRVEDENGVLISSLEPNVIPYAINVFEGEVKFVSAQIVQDASVVRNPFSKDVDPAAELLQTLREAWDGGISLVVCTNRGVLEKAHRDNHMRREVNSEPWFKVLAAIVSAKTSLSGEIPGAWDFDGKKKIFKKVKIGYSHLDNRSLLLGRDTFEQLLVNATKDEHWKHCSECPAKALCPFKANRDWLVSNDPRQRVIELLTRAEVLSGQVIVFREALALISLLLAGCSRDYDGMHPCDWVKSRAEEDDFFSLAARRIYMSLFASHAPVGLEAVKSLREQQLASLQWLMEVMDEDSVARKAVRHVVNGKAPSTDVGITRLLGETGVMTRLDPCREEMPTEFYERWDSDFEVVSKVGGPVITDLERACLSAWGKLEEGLELTMDHSVSGAHWALRRWSSNFLLHLGALVDGRSAWATGLDEFATLLDLVAKAPEKRTPEDRRSIRQLDTKLEKLINAVGDELDSGNVQLSDVVTLGSSWVKTNLKPKTVASEESGSVSLAIEFTGGERAVFAATMYLWLTRRAAGKLDPRCFPQELLAGVKDARIRAAAKSEYAFKKDGVEMSVDGGNGRLFKLARFDGEVDITCL